jgi:hypothetical protein
MNSSYSKPSDQAHRIKVDSNIICCLWLCNRAWAGTDAPFEVRTSLVGEGAEIKVRLVNDSGKVLEKKSDKIYANQYRGAITVPSNVEARRAVPLLHLEVELSKQNLDIESDRVPAGPVIQARKLEWDKKEAHRGDMVTMKAEFIDLPDKTEAEVTVYEYDTEGLHDPVMSIPTVIKNNRLELKWAFKHRDPGTILTQEELKPYGKNYTAPEYFFTIDIDGTKIGVKQESGLMRFVDSSIITLSDEDGSPLENKEIAITFADNSQKKVKTDSKGKIKLENAPPGKFTITLEEKTN